MALQLRRGTNAERLAMTPLIGELIYVTDYELVTFNVTAIDAGTDTLTAVAHGLAVNQQIKFQDASLNGLVLNQVYFVKAVPSSDTFTLSLTLGGSVIDITGTFTIPLVFAKTPTNAAGAPLGTNSTPLWVGDGVTVGGIVAASLNLDDLLDVDITSLAEGNILYYDATTGFWRNTAVVTVDDVNTRVGINDTSPSYTLDVNGTANVETTLTVPSITTLTGDDLSITAFSGRGVGIATTSSSTPVTITRNTAATNAVTNGVILRHATSSSTPAAGMGVGVAFETETAASVFTAGSAIYSISTDVTPGNEDFDLAFYNESAGSLALGMYLTNAGALQITDTLRVNGNQIKNSSGTTIITFDTNETELAGDLQIKGNIIRNDSGNDTITMGTGATGLVTLSGDLQVNGGDITTNQTTFNLLNTTATTVNIGGAATAMSIGNASGTVTIPGNLTINGTTTNINTTNLLVEDKNITIGDVATPTDVTASGGGITLLGATNKTITWNNATDGWEFNQPIKVTGDIVTSGDLAVNGGDITTTQTTFNLVNATATTLNIGGASTATAIGSTASGTTTIGNDLFVNSDVNADSYIVDSLSTYNTQTTTTTSTAATNISSTARASQKVIIRIIDNVSGEIHCLEALAFEKGATAYLTTYAEMYTSAALATFTADVSGGSLRILATPASANSTTFTVARISLD